MAEEFDYSDYGCDDESECEPIGSCEECECDVFESDAYYAEDGALLCDQCGWALDGRSR